MARLRAGHRPLLKLYVRISRIKCARAHFISRPSTDKHHSPLRSRYHGVEFSGGQGRSPKQGFKLSFASLVNEAYHHRISLSDYAHYRFPGHSFDKLKGQGRVLYYTQGVAASEVELDPDTGECKVRRVDILMDLSRPINEGLDLGQVTGGFVQGMGWVTTEKLFYNGNGALLSQSPSTYKIPSVQDTPREFNVELLPNEENYANVRGTKAAGEPPLLLAIGVWTAIGDAIRYLPAYRLRYPSLELPATQEEILRAMLPERFVEWERP